MKVKVRTTDGLEKTVEAEDLNGITAQVQELITGCDFAVTLESVTLLDDEGEESLELEPSWHLILEPPDVTPPPRVLSREGIDAFLQDATLLLREMWEERGGGKIDKHEAESLNDALDRWFGDFKPRSKEAK